MQTPITNIRHAALLLLTWTWASTTTAELVIFAHGGSPLKVTAYAVEGGRVRLELPDGGAIAVPLLQVERILEDEVSDAAPEPPVPPAFALRFLPSQEPPATPFADLIFGAAERHSLNPALVAAVVRAESAFDPQAVSPKGAQGLMQLMPATAQRFGLDASTVFKPAKNLDAGARYLSWLVDRFDGELPSVLAAYNAGEGTVDRYHGVPPYRETRNYLRRIYTTLGLPSSALPQGR